MPCSTSILGWFLSLVQEVVLLISDYCGLLSRYQDALAFIMSNLLRSRNWKPVLDLPKSKRAQNERSCSQKFLNKLSQLPIDQGPPVESQGRGINLVFNDCQVGFKLHYARTKSRDQSKFWWNWVWMYQARVLTWICVNFDLLITAGNEYGMRPSWTQRIAEIALKNVTEIPRFVSGHKSLKEIRLCFERHFLNYVRQDGFKLKHLTSSSSYFVDLYAKNSKICFKRTIKFKLQTLHTLWASCKTYFLTSYKLWYW